jgi:Ras-related C3 botulinum toxin substrate 1
MQTIKCTLVGDVTVGKTGLLIAYFYGYFPTNYIPIALETRSSNVIVDGKSITFSVWDIPGQNEYDRLLPLIYPETNIFLLCFSLVDPISFERVRTVWLPQISHYVPNAPFILVGTKLDLRQDPTTIEELQKYNMAPISYTQGLQMAQELHAVNYLECSAVTQCGLKDIFDEALRAGLYHAQQARRRRVCIML